MRSPCPVACTLDLVGDRWSLLLLRDLLGGPMRYSDLLGAPEGIPTNILAERLKRLEVAGIINRIPYSTRPRRWEYELTARGRELGLVVGTIAAWGLRHIRGTRASPSVKEMLQRKGLGTGQRV